MDGGARDDHAAPHESGQGRPTAVLEPMDQLLRRRAKRHGRASATNSVPQSPHSRHPGPGTTPDPRGKPQRSHLGQAGSLSRVRQRARTPTPSVPQRKMVSASQAGPPAERSPQAHERRSLRSCPRVAHTEGTSPGRMALPDLVQRAPHGVHGSGSPHHLSKATAPCCTSISPPSTALIPRRSADSTKGVVVGPYTGL